MSNVIEVTMMRSAALILSILSGALFGCGQSSEAFLSRFEGVWGADGVSYMAIEKDGKLFLVSRATNIFGGEQRSLLVYTPSAAADLQNKSITAIRSIKQIPNEECSSVEAEKLAQQFRRHADSVRPQLVFWLTACDGSFFEAMQQDLKLTLRDTGEGDEVVLAEVLDTGEMQEFSFVRELDSADRQALAKDTDPEKSIVDAKKAVKIVQTAVSAR